ncbi:HD domain-containing protein [Kineococcus terrestris]|uniref:HD domain-containing protein n=1 Tax=Kineococcus terrestris TaxID=2044856 RepID=UPI0034DB27FD
MRAAPPLRRRHDRPDPLDPAGDLPGAARELARELLGGLHPRWEHSAAVARRAQEALGVVGDDGPALLAAAWLHDLGYAPALRDTGFHPVDGARYLRSRGWPALVCSLVAHHSEARPVAAVRGLSAELAAFDDPRATTGALADALTWADQTTSADGRTVTVGERLDDVLRRHGPDSPNARCHAERAPAVRAAVQRTGARLRGAGR